LLKLIETSNFFQKQFWENFTSPSQKAFMKTCSPTFYLQTKSHLHICSQESSQLASKILSFYCWIFVSVLFQGSTAFPSNSEVGFSTERKRTSPDFRLRDSIRNFKSSFVSGSARHDHRLHRLQVGGRVTGRLQRRTLSKLSRCYFEKKFLSLKKAIYLWTIEKKPWRKIKIPLTHSNCHKICFFN
jgi:hypothetical protein